jgi:aconitate hydratase
VAKSLDSFNCRSTLTVEGTDYVYYSLTELPFSMKVILENLLRNEDGRTRHQGRHLSVAAWLTNKGKAEAEIAYRPARVLMQDFTGVPAVVDLAAMRDA